MASSSLQHMAQGLIVQSKTLINNDLKRILKEEGVVSSGVKATLQARVIGLIDRAVQDNDHALYNRLQHRIANNGASPSSQSTPSYNPQTPTKSSPLVNGNGNMQGYPQPTGFTHYQMARSAPTNHFKASPFFEIRESILEGIALEPSPSHRQNCNKSLTLNETTCHRLRSDRSLRLLLFSAVEQPLAPYTRLDVAFPSQIEVRINGEEARANYKGLKNRPGSTRPADITDLVRIAPANYRNNLLITYALTQKRYNLAIYMVRKFSVEELAKRIAELCIIPKRDVLKDMRKKASDPDIVVESSVMSLKDPISTLKMTVPCRGMLCHHTRCFDLESFLQLQEQAPTWQCPICSNHVSFEALAVDEYVQEILSKVPKAVDQVTVEPDGRWSIQAANTSSKSNAHSDDDDSDEDLVEISGPRVNTIKSEVFATPQSLARTPPIPSREASSAPRTGSKRGSEVIDLTLSDDDEPVRPTKKVAQGDPPYPPFIDSSP
ncbi:unnamed protein product [Periconia digitata]|uniref:Uncharacterized protein n=1 Tax=Periconia digitata TaxID=1303443 RepID=A0A9W4XQ89_9PLEO|nr:unnamed protein product [Periconia digitata]